MRFCCCREEKVVCSLLLCHLWTRRKSNNESLLLAIREVSLTTVTWLILPVVICLSQRLSHACLSINILYCETAYSSLYQLLFIWWYLTTWIPVVILELIHASSPDFLEGMYLLDKKPMQATALLVIHSNFYGSHGFTSATVHSNFCPISFRRYCSGLPWH